MVRYHTLLLALALAIGAMLPVAVPRADAAAVLQLSRTSLAQGDVLTVSGAGFQPAGSVVVYADFRVQGVTQRVQVATVADAGGRFRASLTIPNGVQSQDYRVVARDFDGHIASQIIHILSLILLRPGAAPPRLDILVGNNFFVRGQGWKAGETIALTASFPLYSGAVLTVTHSATADTRGSFGDVLFSVPNGARRLAVTLTGIGVASGLKATAAIVVIYRPSISIHPSSLLPGERTTISGSDFPASTTVRLVMTFPLVGGGSLPLTVIARTDSSGRFSAQMTVPSAALDGTVTITAQAPSVYLTTRLTVLPVVGTISVSSSAVAPGSTVTISGRGFRPNTHLTISVTLTLVSGGRQTVSVSATTNSHGDFSVPLTVPEAAAGGTFDVAARTSSGRSTSTHLTVEKLTPSIVASPLTAVPGTATLVNGFGFASGATVQLWLNGQQLASTRANAAGQFSVRLTIPTNLASGTYTLTASGSGRKANVDLVVNRQIATHFYFASLYTGTGYHEYLDFLNPSAIRSRVTITYEPTSGATVTKTITVDAHSRFTEDVNADLGPHVSAGAAIAADTPLAVERMVFHGSDGDVDSGTTAPSTTWYFANGNTGHGYRLYLAVQNPGSGPVQVALHLYPAHSHAFTVYRTMAPTSRTTFHINQIVRRDAVGLQLTANGPVVANITTFIHHGMTSKTGVPAAMQHWYFAGGPNESGAVNWVAVINPTSNWSHLTVYAYGQAGRLAGMVQTWLRPHARKGYLVNRFAHLTNAALVVMASRPVVAEQMTYRDRLHDAATDSFGVPTPAKAWAFAAVNTNGQGDTLALFNPSMTTVPVVVQFMTSSGAVTQRTYMVPPLNHVQVDAGSVVPNTQLGLVASSSFPFVALNQSVSNDGLAGMASSGIQL